MGLFRRRPPIHEQLARSAGLELGVVTGAGRGLAAEPPGWSGEQRGEPGIHGVPRPARWDVVAMAEAPGLQGDVVHFVALPDGTLLVDEDEPDDSLTPLADAIEKQLRPAYRAECVRRGAGRWAVAAVRVQVLDEPSLEGDTAELVVVGDRRTLTVDGEQRVARAPALQAAGEEAGPEYVVRATRLDGSLWEIEVQAL